MGRVTAPFGVKGWIKIYALTAQLDGLRGYSVWWLGRDDAWREMRVVEARVHSNSMVAKLEGVADRDAAAALKGWEIAVPREKLPGAAENEYYWADLVGLRVVNAEQHEFGRVARILETGANDVLVIEDRNNDERERLIPFIAGVIMKVDLAAGLISVDWGKDF